MRHAGFALAAVMAVIAGCGNGPLRGGSKIADGVYWRLNTLGDGLRLPTDSDSVLVRVRMARPGRAPGSLFSTEQWYGMAGSAWAKLLFGRMRQGDSATALLNAARVPWTGLGAEVLPIGEDTSFIQMELSLRGIRSLAESRALADSLRNIRTAGDEQRALADFLAGSKEKWQKFMGVYYVLDKGAGPPVQSGQLVTLSYIARFLENGEVFDDQQSGGRSITFRLGDPDQVIKGLEIAAHVLPQKGGSGRFIIPSELAFGPRGSSSGIVPPWTPVLYEVQVDSVKGAATAT